jgi:hypothetical protein
VAGLRWRIEARFFAGAEGIGPCPHPLLWLPSGAVDLSLSTDLAGSQEVANLASIVVSAANGDGIILLAIFNCKELLQALPALHRVVTKGGLHCDRAAGRAEAMPAAPQRSHH